MFAFLAALVLAQSASTTPIVLGAIETHEVRASDAAALERGLRDAFAGARWALASSDERDEAIAGARDAGTQVKAAPAVLGCTAMGLGSRVRLDCRLASTANQTILWTDKQACGADLTACARALGQRARKHLDASPPPTR